MSVIAERTRHVAGLAAQRGGSGDPSPFTALGVESAIRACCERVFGSQFAARTQICVIGLGHVGSRVAKRCARDGAKLLVADVDRSKRALADELGARWTTPERALDGEVDVLAPCALGGFLDDETVPRLRCRIVAGAANNQLADDRIADLLAAREILWAPDFVVNAGGIINIVEELDEYGPAAPAGACAASPTRSARSSTTPSKRSATPLAAAMELARERLRQPQLTRSAQASRGGPWPLHPVGQPALVGELVQMRRQRHGRGRPQRGGASSQTSSSSSSTLRLPASSAASSRRSRSSRWAMYSSSLAAGSSTGGPWPGPSAEQPAPAQLRQAVEVGGQRAGVGRDEHASLAEHGVAGQSHVADHEREVIRRVARGRDRVERADAAPVGQQHVDVAASRRQRRAREPLAHRRHRLGVVGVVVGQRDPAEPAAALDLLGQRAEVLRRAPARDRPATPDRGRRSTSSCPTA